MCSLDVVLTDIRGLVSLYGEEATDDPAESFEVSAKANEESIRIVFSRDGETDRQVWIEQQGDDLYLYLSTDADAMPAAKICLGSGSVTAELNDGSVISS